VAALFGKALQLDAAVLRSLEERFRRLGRPMPAVNRTQAEVPEGATVLPNPRGTAPGLWVEDSRGRVVVMLPGVPSEMRGLLAEEVLPRLAALTSGAVVRSRSVRTTGIAESALAERVGAIEEEIAPLTLAYLPSTDGVELRVTAWGLRADEAERSLEADGADLAAVVLDQLRARKARLVVAESCTGGVLSARITAIPGASTVFMGGVVAYDNIVKSGMLDVSPELLDQYGAVSEQVVSAMAEGVQRQFAVDAALAITGIAGPTGGTAEKPVGTVWLAARYGAEARALKRLFPGDRNEIRARSAQAALDLLRRLLADRQ